MTQRACVFIPNVDDSEVRSDCNGSQSFNFSRSVQNEHKNEIWPPSYIMRGTYCWHCQSALSTVRDGWSESESIIFELDFTISRWSRALIRSSSLRFTSTARDISSFMSSASGLPRIMSIIAGSRSLRSTGGRSVGAPSRGVEFSIDHLRRDCIVIGRVRRW